MAAATRRASCRSASVQQRPNEVCPSVWSYNCIDRPMTSWPCSASSAAATEESTPPDIATTIRIFWLLSPRLPPLHPPPVGHENTKPRKHEEEKQIFFVFSCFAFSCLYHCPPS